MEKRKPQIIKDFNKVPQEIQEQLKLLYPNGYSHALISFTNAKGELESAVPFETEDVKYMIRMSGKMAKRVIDTDDDDDSPDSMKDELYDNLSDNFSDMEFPAEEDDVEDVPDVADEADEDDSIE